MSDRESTDDPRIVIAGSVGSSLRTLLGLLKHECHVVGVLGLAEAAGAAVSDYRCLRTAAGSAGVPYAEFNKINDEGTIATVRSWSPDLFFVVGLSQLVSSDLLAIPARAAVGFHPTLLPEGRGRAPIAWILLDGVPAAATFFEMTLEPDAGPILAQEPFEVAPEDHAAEVYEKLERAIDRALERWLPRLRRGEWSPSPQEESRATWYGRRSPEDGLVDWTCSAEEVVRVVRAASRPHPGAFGFHGDRKLLLWRARFAEGPRHRGVVGRVLVGDPEGGYLVQAGSGAVWLEEIEAADGGPVRLRPGDRIASDPESDLQRLSGRLDDLERRVRRIETEGAPS
jgi:methionyl-tRNA formyltransferase